MNPVIDKMKSTLKNVSAFAKNLFKQDISDAEDDERLQAEIAANSALQEAMDEVMGYETNLNPNPKKTRQQKQMPEKGQAVNKNYGSRARAHADKEIDGR